MRLMIAKAIENNYKAQVLIVTAQRDSIYTPDQIIPLRNRQ